MAQTKKKRTRKHRGTPAGTIERAGRTGRPQTREEAKKIARDRRTERLEQAAQLAGRGQPGGHRRGGVRPARGAAARVASRCRAWCSAAVMFVFYIPLGYFTDTMIFRYRQKRAAQGR